MGWCEKGEESGSHRETADCQAALAASAAALVRELAGEEPSFNCNFKEGGDKKGDSKKAAGKLTLGAKFNLQLGELMRTLNASTPHFVRCIRPNVVLRPAVFDAPRVLQQLKCNGLVEVCQVGLFYYWNIPSPTYP